MKMASQSSGGDRERGEAQGHVHDENEITELREHVELMKLAIAEAEKSKPVPSAYCVGCVVVESGRAERLQNARLKRGVDGKDRNEDENENEKLEVNTFHRVGDGEWRFTFTGFSRELPGNTHAEECALAKAAEAIEAYRREHGSGADDAPTLKGCDMYATMEPCSKRLSGKTPCVTRCLAAGVGRVFVGVHEPDHFVRCEGVAQLRSAGVRVVDVCFRGCEQACLKPNAHIPGLKALSERFEKLDAAAKDSS